MNTLHYYVSLLIDKVFPPRKPAISAEEQILLNSLDKPDTWKWRRLESGDIRGSGPGGVWVDSWDYYPHPLVVRPAARARHGKHEFSRAFALLWHETARERLERAENEQKENLAGQVGRQIREVFGE